MKRLIGVLLIAVVLLGACASYTNFEYTKISGSVDIFTCFTSYGGKVEQLEVSENGEAFISVRFNEKGRAADAVKTINVSALDQNKYNSGYRVMELKTSADYTAVIYVRDINHLSSSVSHVKGDVFKKEYPIYSLTELKTASGEIVPVQSVADTDTILIIKGMPSIKISVKGKIKSSSSEGRQTISSNSVVYSTNEALVVFKKSYTSVILIGVVCGIGLLAFIFVFLLRMRLFTKLKMKKVKENGEF